MANATIIVNPIHSVASGVERGTILVKGYDHYVLMTTHDEDKNAVGALVNIRTGETIHTLKPVTDALRVTADELASMNFAKSSPVTIL